MTAMPFDGAPSAQPIKVAFTKNTFEFDLHPAVERALNTARDALAAAGYAVEEVEPPLLREAAVAGARCLFGEAKALMDADVRKYGSESLWRGRVYDIHPDGDRFLMIKYSEDEVAPPPSDDIVIDGVDIYGLGGLTSIEGDRRLDCGFCRIVTRKSNYKSIVVCVGSGNGGSRRCHACILRNRTSCNS